MKLNRFYPIVGSADWIERLVPLGVKLIQLRIKNRPPEVVAAGIARSKRICDRHHCRLIVNDHWEAAMAANCDWVHLGQGDLDSADVPAIRRAGLHLGVSTHDHEELDRALSLDADYVALGPVYPTRLKKMPWAPQGLGRIREWRGLIGERPLVAIGGLTVERLPPVFAAGADSAAVVTDITLHAEPETRTREWLSATAREAA